MADTRIVYGARCSWWGAITDVGTVGTGLPCCPHCHGVLFEVGDEGEWWAGVDRYEADGHPGYRAFVEWLRGRCYPAGIEAARAAYDETELSEPTFWNGEPTPARRVRVIVGESPIATWWCAGLAGSLRKAVEVTYGGQRFYLDDEDGSGWRKVTEGHGGPRWGSRSLPDTSRVVA